MKTTYLLIITVLITNLYAEKSLRASMLEMAKNMEELLPHIYDKESFSSSYHKKFIQKRVLKTQELLHKLKPHFDKRPVSYQVSYKLIKEHIDLSVNVYNEGHHEFARSTLKALPGLCVSCHTQDANSKKIFRNIQRKKFPTDLAYAEYNFMTRNFSMAKKYYDKFIYDNYGDGSYNVVADALKNKVLIQSVLLKNSNKLKKELNDLNKENGILPMLKNDIKDYLVGLERLKMPKAPTDFIILKKYVNEALSGVKGKGAFFLDRTSSPQLMQVRQFLYSYLSLKANKEQIPQILLWLAKIDKKLNFNLFYGLSDLYLKSCITDYPKSPYANQCYMQYKEQIEEGFTGSSGTSMPSDLKEELIKLKELIDKNYI